MSEVAQPAAPEAAKEQQYKKHCSAGRTLRLSNSMMQTNDSGRFAGEGSWRHGCINQQEAESCKISTAPGQLANHKKAFARYRTESAPAK